MTVDILDPILQRRLNRVARVLDRAHRWQRLAFLDDVEADAILEEYEACSDMNAEIDQDDAAAPAGPRNDKNKSRYQVQPGHAQNLSDVLRTTAGSQEEDPVSKFLGFEPNIQNGWKIPNHLGPDHDLLIAKSNTKGHYFVYHIPKGSTRPVAVGHIGIDKDRVFDLQGLEKIMHFGPAEWQKVLAAGDARQQDKRIASEFRAMSKLSKLISG